VLEMHQNLNIDNLYILWLKTPKGMDSDLEDEGKVWIPLLPGYSILTKKEKFIRLTISVKDNNELEYIYENFDNDCTFTHLKETRCYKNMFRNFKNELGVSEKISVPSLLGFDNVENVIYLRNKVLEKYQFLSNPHDSSILTNLDEDEGEDPVEDKDENSANIEDPIEHEDLVEDEVTDPKTLATCNTNKKIKKTLKRKGLEISINAVKEKVQNGIYTRSKGIRLSPKSIQTLMVSDHLT